MRNAQSVNPSPPLPPLQSLEEGIVLPAHPLQQALEPVVAVEGSELGDVLERVGPVESELDRLVELGEAAVPVGAREREPRLDEGDDRVLGPELPRQGEIGGGAVSVAAAEPGLRAV